MKIFIKVLEILETFPKIIIKYTFSLIPHAHSYRSQLPFILLFAHYHTSLLCHLCICSSPLYCPYICINLTLFLEYVHQRYKTSLSYLYPLKGQTMLLSSYTILLNTSTTKTKKEKKEKGKKGGRGSPFLNPPDVLAQPFDTPIHWNTKITSYFTIVYHFNLFSLPAINLYFEHSIPI